MKPIIIDGARDIGVMFDDNPQHMVGQDGAFSIPLESGRFDASDIECILDETIAKGGWLIFYTHDVASSPSRFGCTPGFLEKTIQKARRRDTRILSIAEALQCFGA